ncbi:unnamed protein product [Brassica oleracea]
MVSSRIVDLPKDDVTDAMLPIPEMMFAASEEPVGVRVLTYQSSRAINHILNSLEEDEIQTLCMSAFGKIQNTIAVKGFALALQLVMVEAVPALTKVVLETCSSSESDSCDEDDDLTHKKTKKQTLSPGHAREVDKKTDVCVLSSILVRSIIPEDPDRPIVAANLVWADEVVDVKVKNLLKLITQRHLFTAEMFKGGATKLDVKRMREIAKAGGSRRGKLNLIHTWKHTRISVSQPLFCRC